MHTLLLGEEHEVTPAQSKLSQTQTCQEHPENILTLACRACHSMFCSSCSTESDCESSSETDARKHSIVDVNLLAEELREKMRTESIGLADRIELVCCEEKLIPTSLDEVENKVSQMIRAVDMAANRRILDIQNKSASAKDKLKFFSKSAKKETLTRSTKLKTKREQLQSLLQFMHQISSNSPQLVVAAQHKLSAMLKESDIGSVVRSLVKYSSNALNQNGMLAKLYF
ncbi:uncharacterized protein [Watersipora subatra]|uniref:uncharacterized protein n=1 Tax=Watersipora subatra TaxID=2589382 RepID=UPI00355AEDC2